MSRKGDPAIADILRHMRQINIQNPEYDAIKKILEEGADGRYLQICSCMNDDSDGYCLLCNDTGRKSTGD